MEQEKKEEQNTEPKKKEENVVMAALSYFGILVLIPLLTDAKKDPFVKFHVKQGIILLIAGFANMFISIVPFIGWIAGFVIWIALLVFFVMGLINVFGGKKKELPVIGQYADKIKI